MKESSYVIPEYGNPSMGEKEEQELEWDHDFDLNSLSKQEDNHSLELNA
ncbi:hypothetical protein [Bacteroidetes bacterium endosymbiont of Geopemphigus sp.]|nr:hypothetical protein [Bacteroidetes bacterium endosymbiont of Geopemphigus sp.]